MSGRIFSMKQLREEHEEWYRPSEIVITKKDLSSTKRELLERIRELEAENAELKERIKAADRAIAGLLRDLKGGMEGDSDGL